MERTKEELIANLYALRAGLSVISLEYDTVKQIKEEVKTQQERAQSSEKKINLLNKTLHSTRSFDDSENTKLDERKKTLLAEKEGDLKKVDEKMRAPKKGLVGCAVATILLMLPIINFLVQGMPAVGIPYGGIILLMWAIYLIIFFRKRSEINSEKNKVISDYEMRLKQSEDNTEKRKIADAKKKEDAQKNLEREQQNLERYRSNLVEAKNKYKETTSVSLKKTTDILQVMMVQYASVISINDWANMDLIVYYLSTGRADTMKEALQLYDRQRQSFKQSEQNVRNTINSSFVTFKAAIERCLNELSRKLELQQQQVSQQDLYQAVVSKIYTDSHELVADMDSMKAESSSMSKSK